MMTLTRLSPQILSSVERVFQGDEEYIHTDGPGETVVCKNPLGGAILAIEEGAGFGGIRTHQALSWLGSILRGDTVNSYQGPMWPGMESFRRSSAPLISDEQPRLDF